MDEYKILTREECVRATEYLFELAERVLQPPPFLYDNPQITKSKEVLDTLIMKVFPDGKDQLS